MVHDADAAREHARAANGEFGTQRRTEAELELAGAAAGPADGEPWNADEWDGLVFALRSRREDPDLCLVDLLDAARAMGRQEVFDRHAYRSADPTEDFDRIVTELTDGRSGRHLLTGQPLPAQTVAEVSASLESVWVHPTVPPDTAAAELAAAAVECESLSGVSSARAIADHIRVSGWAPDEVSSQEAARLVCEDFGIPDHHWR